MQASNILQFLACSNASRKDQLLRAIDVDVHSGLSLMFMQASCDLYLHPAWVSAASVFTAKD